MPYVHICRHSRVWVALSLLLAIAVPALGQEGPAAASNPSDAESSDADAPRGYRKLAPGVLTTVPANHSAEDTASTHDFVEALSLVPDANFTPYTTALSNTLKAKATTTVFRRPVWNVEFSFKPVRFINVDLPGENGKLERKLVWYMVFRIRNTGGHLKPVLHEDGKYEIQRADYPVRVFPQFVLESHEYKKAYMDQVLPAAIDSIRRREDANRPLLTTVEISKVEIPVTTGAEDDGVWGVATWTDIDLRIDFFSVYVKGLSSAYRWTDANGEFVAGSAPGTGKSLTQKALQLNFWRPGDEYSPNEGEIRFGIPGQVDYTWIYR